MITRPKRQNRESLVGFTNNKNLQLKNQEIGLKELRKLKYQRKLYTLKRNREVQKAYERIKPYQIINLYHKGLIIKKDDYRFNIEKYLNQYTLIYHGDHLQFKTDIISRLKKSLNNTIIWENTQNYNDNLTPQAYVITTQNIDQLQQNIVNIIEYRK